MPVSLPRLAQFISMGCLSLLDFLNLPDHKPYSSLRTLIKQALNQKPGAPEIITGILSHSTLDPELRWLMAALRLWHLVLQLKPPKDDVDTIIEEAKGRLGKSAVFAFRWGVCISVEGFRLAERFLPVREPWFIARKVILKHLKKQQCLRLAARRPATFGGLLDLNVKAHLAFLRTLNPLQSTILRLWSGSAMCAYKRAQVYGEQAHCACGAETQNVYHLLWQCPLTPPPRLHIMYLKDLLACRSVSHLLPPQADQRDIRDWRDSCRRALTILSMRSLETDTRQHESDNKGHDVTKKVLHYKEEHEIKNGSG